VHQDNAADIFVQRKTYPHAYQSISQWNTDEIAQPDSDAPLEDDTDDERIDNVASGSKCATREDV
jgi:hypothetical protein